MVSADIPGIAVDLHVSIQAVSRATGSATELSLGLSAVAWSVISVKIGKRPVYLAGALLMLAGSILAQYSL